MDLDALHGKNAGSLLKAGLGPTAAQRFQLGDGLLQFRQAHLSASQHGTWQCQRTAAFRPIRPAVANCSKGLQREAELLLVGNGLHRGGGGLRSPKRLTHDGWFFQMDVFRLQPFGWITSIRPSPNHWRVGLACRGPVQPFLSNRQIGMA